MNTAEASPSPAFFQPVNHWQSIKCCQSPNLPYKSISAFPVSRLTSSLSFWLPVYKSFFSSVFLFAHTQKNHNCLFSSICVMSSSRFLSSFCCDSGVLTYSRSFPVFLFFPSSSSPFNLKHLVTDSLCDFTFQSSPVVPSPTAFIHSSIWSWRFPPYILSRSPLRASFSLFPFSPSSLPLTSHPSSILLPVFRGVGLICFHLAYSNAITRFKFFFLCPPRR